MSDTAKKPQSPTSVHGSNGGRATEERSEVSKAAESAPRSVVTNDGGKSTAEEHEHDEADDAQGNYTHEKESGLTDIQEEGDRAENQGEDQLHVVDPEAMEDVGDEASTGLQKDTEDTPSELQKDTEGAPSDLQKDAEAEIPEQEESKSKTSGAKTSLTESAKHAFDLASENQPTDKARDDFLQNATSQASKKSPPEAEGVEDETVLPKDSITSKDLPLDSEGAEKKDTEAPSQQETGAGEDVPESQATGKTPPAEGTEVTQTEGTAAEEPEGTAEEETEQPLDLTILKDGVVNKGGNIIVDGKVVGRVIEGKLSDLINRRCDENGVIWSDNGKQLGKAEPFSDSDLEELRRESSPFENFPNAVVDANGLVTDGQGGEIVGRVVEGDLHAIRGKSVDADGDVLDKAGNTIGRCVRVDLEEEPELEPEVVDRSILAGARVTKMGYLVDEDECPVGRVVEGILDHLVGKKSDENGDIFDGGKKLGRAEVIPDSEREDLLKEGGPFEAFPDATLDGNGQLIFNGEIVGRLVEGDAKALRGKSPDASGEILDRLGRKLGVVERWEPEPEPEPEAEPEPDRSALAGGRVTKTGYVVDGNGRPVGRIIEGDVSRLEGKQCDSDGAIWLNGKVIGRAEVDTEISKESAPFEAFSDAVVSADGMIRSNNEIIGKVVEGDIKALRNKKVSPSGEILDQWGSVVGKAIRWEEDEKPKHPLAGRKVNKKGEVVDEAGDVAGKLTTGDLRVCAGKEVDDDGDVISKGVVIGHVSLLEDIPDEESETEDEKAKKEKAEVDKKLAIQMSVCIEQCLDKIRPICKMITEKIEAAERQPEDERDEEQLVKEVRPLIEEGGHILQEAKGILKGLDPDGRLQANAKHKTAAREATPEEYKLADVLKELTGEVTQCIDGAKKKLEGMPYAKKELNPLWGLLNEPLFQILTAVGLLLNGVLSLVGRLLSGLGLGGLVDGLLGTLGINRVLEGLGLGSVSGALKGGKKGGGGGGLLGGLLGGGGKK
jgi:hypothetical protein